MTEMLKISTEPKAVFAEFETGNNYKSSIGDHGIFEQTKMNERFFSGDQWHGAKCGNDRPLVRMNVIRRIGEYKLSIIGGAPVSVRYSAEGVESTKQTVQDAEIMREKMLGGEFTLKETPDAVEVEMITDAMSRYQKTTAERVQFGVKMGEALLKAYKSGSGIAYTCWDEEVKTGLFADEDRTTPITGDIGFEILDVENVIFGDPNNNDVQSQPYILISQRLDVEAVRREARRNGLPDGDIIPDGATHYNSGERGESEPTDSRRVTVITKLYKKWNKDDATFKVMAVKVTEKATVKKPWDVGLTMYPLAKFNWNTRHSCAYGESEVTCLIPNQIAINRMLTAECWAAISVGMPKMIVNRDYLEANTRVTNDPGQIIEVYAGTDGNLGNIIHYETPPYYASQYQGIINDLIGNTLSNSGANEAALGDIRPDNAAAIIQMREASQQPLQAYQTRYYNFIEEIARIWADFMLSKYGKRPLKVETRDGVQYIPFDAKRYRNLVLTARVDVGASTLYSEAATISTLDAMLGAQLITPAQYLERLPKGLVPKLTELIDDMKKQQQAAEEQQRKKEDILATWAQQNPAAYSQFLKTPKEEQEAMLQQAMASMGGM
jgi:hypothetical protein